MSEEEMLDRIAQIWVDSGGDAEGIAWCWRRIQTRVAQLQSAQQAGEADGAKAAQQAAPGANNQSDELGKRA